MKTMRVWTGPVHAQKSKRALAAARRSVRLGHDVVLVRPIESVRDHECPGFLTTKDGEQWPSIDVESPELIHTAAEGATMVWVDEPSLFSEEEEPQVFGIIQKLRRTKRILISGLCATSELEIFRESMMRLVAVADRVYWLRADCDHCKTLGTATRSWHICGKTEQVDVGGVDQYQALCPSCWSTAMEERMTVKQ